MSNAYCILNVPKESMLKIAIESGQFQIGKKDNGLIQISIGNSKDENSYAAKKRVALAKMTNQAPDDLSASHARSTVYLDVNAPDSDNTHFQGFTVSLSNPEVVLDKLGELAANNGFDPVILSEHDSEYQEIFNSNDEIEEEDLP